MLHATRRTVLAGAAPLLAATTARANDLARGRFTHGVASGDPDATSVVIWTRFAPATAGAASLRWEVADDEAFVRVRARGAAAASPFDDHCVKVVAGGLQPGRPYFYRFLGADGPSPTGRTRTAPARAQKLSFALFSCANMPFGHFHAYAHAARREDIDLAIHVGDYIYEYPRGTYPSAEDALPGRVIEPATETVALSDYHARYASYRADPALQDLHRTTPFLAVWDDHELTNDAYWTGAQNHQPATEGDWTVRRALAAKAWADWMPSRPQASVLQIYRRIAWGDLADILMLDTRLIGRDKQLDWRSALAPAMAEGGPSLEKVIGGFGRGALSDPARSMLGAPQEAWMRGELQRSRGRGATWQVLAQQLVTGNQMFASSLARFLADDASAQTRQFVNAGAAAGAQGFGWNLDSWSGYPAARTRFLDACARDAANAFIVSGDSHNAWANALPGGKDGRPAAVEFAGGSVTSPGFERTFRKETPEARAAAMVGANPELKWCDVTHRGYGVATLTRQSATVDWHAFADVRAAEAPAPAVARLTSEATRAGPGAWTV